MKRKRLWIALAALGTLAAVAGLAANVYLANAFEPGPSKGPFTADNSCPSFRARYRQCQVAFGNSGLSKLNSLYETFIGEGAFEITGFEVETLPGRRFNINARSNRGPIKSEIHTDRLVRLGQDRENEVVYRTNQSAFCDAGRIYEHQAVYVDGKLNAQDLEFWTDRDRLRFRLFQNGAPTADVTCEP